MLNLWFLLRFLPDSLASNTALYNLVVVALSVLIAAIALVPLVLAAIIASFLVSEKLAAGMAGMSIILIFVSAAALMDLIFLLVLIAKNLRWK